MSEPRVKVPVLPSFLEAAPAGQHGQQQEELACQDRAEHTNQYDVATQREYGTLTVKSDSEFVFAAFCVQKLFDPGRYCFVLKT